MRNFVLAILIAVLITYSFGLVASEWFISISNLTITFLIPWNQWLELQF